MPVNPVYLALGAANPGLIGLAFVGSGGGGGSDGGRFFRYYVEATGWRLWKCNILIGIGAIITTGLLMAIIALGFAAGAFVVMFFSSLWIGVPAAICVAALTLALCFGLLSLWFSL